MAETVGSEDDANPFRAARVRAGLTQTQVASQLGVRPATVVAWEQGTQPQRATLERIADLYGVDSAELRQPAPRPKATDGGLHLADSGAPVVIDPYTFGRIVERLEMTAEMVELLDAQHAAIGKTAHGIGDSLDAIRATLRKLAGGVQHAIQQLPPRAGITDAQIEADVEAVRRERAAASRSAAAEGA